MKKTKPIEYIESDTFRQEPDNSGDTPRPRWMTSYPKEGDAEEGEVLEFKLNADELPPGARVVIQIPVCPKCGDPADVHVAPRTAHAEWPNCSCGWSWSKWSLGRYH